MTAKIHPAAVEAAKAMAHLEYEFLHAVAVLDRLADKIASADCLLPFWAVPPIRRVASMRDDLQALLLEIDEPITQLVAAVGG